MKTRTALFFHFTIQCILVACSTEHSNSGTVARLDQQPASTMRHFYPNGVTMLDFIPTEERLKRSRNGTPQLKAPPGTYAVEGHGTPHAMKFRNGQPLTPEVLADRIHMDPSYRPGMPVYLLSCETGAGSHSFAQQLADEMQTPVVAPTAKLWFFKGGAYTIAEAQTKTALGFIPVSEEIRDPSRPGYMKTFTPSTVVLAANEGHRRTHPPLLIASR